MIISAVLPIPGHLIVPDCFCPGRETQTCDSGTVPSVWDSWSPYFQAASNFPQRHTTGPSIHLCN